MKFTGKSIRTLDKLLALSKGVESIRLVFDTTDINAEAWTPLGFNENLVVGDHLIPKPVGRVTEYNANGKELVRKDLSKERVSVSFHTSWNDWHGQPHSGIKNRSMLKYPRDYIAAPSEYLNVLEVSGRIYLGSDEMSLDTGSEVKNLHIANVMLECFNEFEVVDVASHTIVGTKVKRLHWNVLPPGQYPWSKAKPIVEDVTRTLKASDKALIEDRMRLLAKYNPKFLATGRGGFTGYFVYGYSGTYVLESVHLDNATYVFENDWESVSKLTT